MHGRLDAANWRKERWVMDILTFPRYTCPRHATPYCAKCDAWRGQSTILETSESYLHLLEEPRLVSMLDAVVGEDVKCVELGARTVPGADGSSGSEQSYTHWHRDFGREGLGQQWQFSSDHPTVRERFP
jgi:hypothetical protein